MGRTVNLLALAIIVASIASSPRAAMIPPDSIFLEQLPSGLTVAVAEDHSAPVVAVRIVAKAGSITEGKYSGSGISHFVEHMLSCGTDKMTKEQIETLSDQFGGLINAYTTRDHTCLWASAPSLYFQNVLTLLSHCYISASFPPNQVNIQRGIIQKEIIKDLDEPLRVLWRLMMSTMFKRHPCRLPTIGYKDLFLRLTRDDLVDYYRKMYVPQNTIVVVVGDIDRQKAMASVKKAFEAFEPRPFSPPLLPQEPLQMCQRTATASMNVNLGYLMLGFRTVPLQHPDLYALDLLAAVLGQGRSGRLVRTIKDDQCLVQEITAISWTARYGVGAFLIRAVLPPENLEQTVQAILSQIGAVKKKPIPAEELDKAKKLVRSRFLFDVQTAQDKAARIASDILATADVRFSSRYLQGIASVTPDVLLSVARRYFDKDRLCIASVLPKSVAKKRTRPANAAVKVPTIHKTVLENGLRLLTKKGATQGTVSIQAYFLGGTRYETKKTNGVANLMVQLMLKGTKSRTADQIASTIDKMGAKLTASSDMNTFHISLEVLPEDLKQALTILSDIITNPLFDPDQFEREKRLLLAAIKRRQDLWYSAASQLMLQELFTSHPYRLDKLGSARSVSNLTIDDVWDYYDSYVNPDNMVLAVFGAPDEKQAVQLVKESFSQFAGKTIPPQISLDPPLAKNLTLTKATGFNQAVICYGFRSCSVASKDRFALDVLDAILSGVRLPGGRLHQRLRQSRLVYLVHAYNRLGKDPGWFAILAATSTEKLPQVEKAIDDEIRRIKQAGIPPEELDKAKTMCISANIVYRQQTNSQQATSASLAELYGLGFDAFLRYPECINAVTTSDVKHAANTYLTNFVKVKMTPKAR